MVDEAWKDVMLMVRKKAADSPRTWEAKGEDFAHIIGPLVLENMGVPTEQVILLYRLMIAHSESFHHVVKDVLHKRHPSPPIERDERGKVQQTQFEKAMTTLADPEELRRYPRIKVSSPCHLCNTPTA